MPCASVAAVVEVEAQAQVVVAVPEHIQQVGHGPHQRAPLVQVGRVDRVPMVATEVIPVMEQLSREVAVVGQRQQTR